MLNRHFKKDSFRGIITMKNIIAKAQSRILPSKKGTRLRENLTELRNEAAIASSERAKKKLHVANAKDVQRWQKSKNHFRWGSLLKSCLSIRKQSTNGFIKDGLT